MIHTDGLTVRPKPICIKKYGSSYFSCSIHILDIKAPAVIVLDKQTTHNYVLYRWEKGNNSVNNECIIMQPTSDWSAHEILIVYQKIRVLGQTVQKLEKCQFQQRGIIQSFFDGIRPKVNQVIYTLAPSNMPNMSILTQTIFTGFWEQTFM